MKRILILALCLALFCPAALAETFVVDVGGGEERDTFALLLRDDGTALTPEGEYAALQLLTPADVPEADRRYAAEPAALVVDLAGRDIDTLEYWDYHRVALMDGVGKRLTGYDYCDLTRLSDGSIAFQVPEAEGVRVGVMDADARVLVPAKYAAVQSLGGGRWLAMVREGDSLYALVVVDAEGGETATGLHTDYAYLPEGGEGPCAVYNVQEADRRAVYVNAEGKMAFLRSFEGANGFYGNLAAVEDEGRYGLIDREGRVVVPMEYDYIFCETSVPPGVYAAERGAELTLFDAMTGEALMKRDFAPSPYISESLSTAGLVWVSTNDALYAFSYDGVQLGVFKGGEDLYYQALSCDADALRVIENAGTWPNERARLLDAQGQRLSGDYRFLTELLWRDGAGRFVCAVVSGGAEGTDYSGWQKWRYGVIDENGRELLPTVYFDYIQALSPDRFWVSTADRSGMIDASGKWYYTIDKYAYLMD